MRTEQEIAFLKAELCDRVASGESQTRARQALSIHWREAHEWKTTDKTFATELATADEAGYDVLADGLTTINERVTDPRWAQVISSNVKWTLSKRRPEVFGDKVTINDDRADLTDIIRQAIARIPRPAEPVCPAIELQVTPR